jgi:hypothetical protein
MMVGDDEMRINFNSTANKQMLAKKNSIRVMT